MGVHVHSHSHHIHVAGALSVSKQGSLDPLGPRQDPKLRCGHAAAPVIVGMETENHIVPVFQMFVHIFQLAGEHMGHGVLHRGGDIDDGLIILRGLPHIQHRVAHIHRIVYFRSRKTLRAVLEGKVAVRLGSQLQKKLRPVHCDLLDLFLALLKHLLSLSHGSGIVEMHHRVGCSLHCLEGPLDNVLPGLGQNLDRHVIGDHVLLDQGPHEFIFGLGGRGESHLDLLESDVNQHLEEFQLLLQAHGFDQRLVPVS